MALSIPLRRSFFNRSAAGRDEANPSSESRLRDGARIGRVNIYIKETLRARPNYLQIVMKLAKGRSKARGKVRRTSAVRLIYIRQQRISIIIVMVHIAYSRLIAKLKTKRLF